MLKKVFCFVRNKTSEQKKNNGNTGEFFRNYLQEIHEKMEMKQDRANEVFEQKPEERNKKIKRLVS